MRKILSTLIMTYQSLLRPFLPPACRFYPSCSDYARQAVEERGLAGLWLAARRLLRCHPFHPGGVDPLPKRIHG
jgi:putative membrane protein insertion efficiency factor